MNIEILADKFIEISCPKNLLPFLNKDQLKGKIIRMLINAHHSYNSSTNDNNDFGKAYDSLKDISKFLNHNNQFTCDYVHDFLLLEEIKNRSK